MSLTESDLALFFGVPQQARTLVFTFASFLQFSQLSQRFIGVFSHALIDKGALNFTLTAFCTGFR
jgi:hypothetical protein